jgi:hypothetical protein
MGWKREKERSQVRGAPEQSRYIRKRHVVSQIFLVSNNTERK